MRTKLTIFITIILLIASYLLVFLLPAYKKSVFLRSQNNVLQKQQEQNEINMEHQHHLEKELISLKNSNSSHPSSSQLISGNIYKKLVDLSNIYHLKLMQIRPFPLNMADNVKKQIFLLQINGSEQNLLYFLKSLLLQNWLIAFDELDFTHNQVDIHLQTKIVFYQIR